MGGLSAALVLSHNGYDVTVFERNLHPGGKAGNLELGSYRFDTGPSLLTMPFVIDRLFDSVGERREEHLEFVRLDPITRYFFPDGTVLDASADPERFSAEVQEKLDVPADRVRAYLRRCSEIYSLAGDLFLFEDLGRSLLSLKALWGVLNSWRLDLFKTMHQVNYSKLKEKRLVQLFDRYATYNGSDPYRISGIFNMIQHVEYDLGSYAVKGGIFAIPKALHRLSEEKGANFRFGEEVERILVERGRARGVITGSKHERFDIVLSNSDVAHTYGKLLEDGSSKTARRYARMEPSVSGAVFYIGIQKAFDDLLVNNIFFSSDYEREFKDIFERRRCPEDPTVYVNITSKVDPEDAPPGCENWFVLVNAPWDSGQDWRSEMERTRSSVIQRVGKALGCELAKEVEVVGTLHPSGIQKRYLTNKGSIYGVSSNDRNAAFLRQGSRAGGYEHLYFAGGSAHPGGGIPLVISSGMIAARSIMRGEK